MTDTTQNKNGGTFKVTGDWATQSKKLKEKYNQLTDADLKHEPGKDNELLSRIGNRLNKQTDEVIDIIKKGQTEKADTSPTR